MRLLAVLSVFLVLLGGQTAGAAPHRVVSINLCADQLLVALAEPGQIASLTALATDPDLSFVARQAGRYPANHAQIEEILAKDPDLILAGLYTAGPAVAFFRQRAVPVTTIGLPVSFDDIRTEVRTVAAALGVPDKGEAVVAAMDRDLAAIGTPAARGRAIAWQPGGFTAGAGTLTDTVLRAAGFSNVAAELGLNGYGYLPLETVIDGAPDVLIAEARMPDRPSLREALLQHPAIARMAKARRIEIPGALWSCGGPFTVEAVRRLAVVGAS